MTVERANLAPVMIPLSHSQLGSKSVSHGSSTTIDTGKLSSNVFNNNNLFTSGIIFLS